MPYLLFYHILFRHLLSFDIHEAASIGDGLIIYHCFGIAVNPNVVIGQNCQIGHCTTLGHGKDGACPIIGNHVIIAPGCYVIGGIQIGDDVSIGVGSVVVNSIPPHAVAVGNPAKVIKYKPTEQS